MQDVTTEIIGGKKTATGKPRTHEDVKREAVAFLAEYAKQQHVVKGTFLVGEKYADENGNQREAKNDGFVTIPSRVCDFLTAQGIDASKIVISDFAGAGMLKTWRLPSTAKKQ